MNISIIIPYWKREKQIDLIFSSLAKQVPKNIEVEVLICDSNSGGDIDKIIYRAQCRYKNLSIKHIQCENIVSQKRNIGIRNAAGDLLIFLDDDCVPNANYFDNIFSDLKFVNGGVLCGEVRFPEYLVNASNYYRYRDSKHPTFISYPYKSLDQWSFVSMNMVVKRDDFVNSQLFYDERFIGYGCEDHEFPWRLLKSNLKIHMGSFCIEHHEYDGDITKYKRKIFCTARDGMYVLANIAPDIIKSHNNLEFIESIYSNKKLFPTLMRTISIFLFNDYISNVIEIFLKKTDKNPKMYFPKMYKYVLLCSYLSGVRSRDEKFKKIDLGQGWYG
ncbi:MAG: glycosyltransferase [Glaciimonas sp.]|nr:glycosyltransferase [Glaciimonas sp.]